MMNLQSKIQIPKSGKKGPQTVFWWIVWILLTIGSFFLAAALWTPILAEHVGSVRERGYAALWTLAVFGTWMVMLLPLIVVMYRKVDKAYEDARIAREKAARRFRSIEVERSQRLLSEHLTSKLAALPETIKGGHLVSVTLKDGRRFPHVFIRDRREILGIYNQSRLPFKAHEVTEIEEEDPRGIASSFIANWLRLDGAKPPV